MGSSRQGQRPPRTRRSVFVSSTSRDLVAHRQQISDTLLRLGLFPVAMEQFGARGSGDATSVSTDKVAEAEVYLGIVAWRYGFVPPGETRSVTHLEYLEARRLGLPCYLFLAHSATEPDDALFPASLRDPEHHDQLLAFRDELQRSVVDYFTTPDDLARKVASALTGYLLEKEREPLSKGARPVGARSVERDGLERALTMARRSLAILEEQAAGFGPLHTPAHLRIELEDQRQKVADLEQRLAALEE